MDGPVGPYWSVTGSLQAQAPGPGSWNPGSDLIESGLRSQMSDVGWPDLGCQVSDGRISDVGCPDLRIPTTWLERLFSY